MVGAALVSKGADLAGLRLHDLRHSFASVGAGFGPSVIGKPRGHSNSKTTERYAHLAADPLQRASDAISGKHSALWVSSTTGRQITTKNLGTLISKITREAMGINVSPHLFRTAGASTAAVYGGGNPHLASALLNHRDHRVTEEHYNFSTNLSASDEYALITKFLSAFMSVHVCFDPTSRCGSSIGHVHKVPILLRESTAADGCSLFIRCATGYGGGGRCEPSQEASGTERTKVL